jgi:hypothetical protein
MASVKVVAVVLVVGSMLVVLMVLVVVVAAPDVIVGSLGYPDPRCRFLGKYNSRVSGPPRNDSICDSNTN